MRCAAPVRRLARHTTLLTPPHVHSAQRLRVRGFHLLAGIEQLLPEHAALALQQQLGVRLLCHLLAESTDLRQARDSAGVASVSTQIGHAPRRSAFAHPRRSVGTQRDSG
jgi:hypothetical protein